MNCNHCNADNKDDAKFCANCGSELQKGDGAGNTKACIHCGFENERDAKFCGSCGVDLGRHHQHQRHHHQHQHSQKQPKKKERRVDTKLHWHPALVGLLIIGGVTLFLTIPYITGNPPGRKPRPEPLVEQTSADPKVEANVREVASKFICSCGTCGEQSLDVCTCNTAIQERQFIRNAFQSGQTPDQIVAAVNTTFGWMKREFVTLYDSLTGQTVLPTRDRAGKNGQSTKLAVPPQTLNSLPDFPAVKTQYSKLATASDREAIFSSFRCPCGQCGIEELKDCTCSHPRGAKEVKAFADRKIAEQKYTIAQLIDQLDKNYGGRKF
ncbi:MAG: zinc ribbon domain-containing protein [Ignavibacteriales bacterium]|nr:zinc ribbon domain-containing protein [Ignavibacteriales bacterium]